MLLLASTFIFRAHASIKILHIPKHTVACTTDGETVQKLVSKGLALGDSGETTRLDLGGVERDGVRREAETVGDEAGELLTDSQILYLI